MEEGWGKKRNSGTTAYTFVSPGGKVFKTKGDAKKFIGLLEENGGDEGKAWTNFQNSNKPTTHQLKQIQEMRWDMLTNSFFQGKFVKDQPQDTFPLDLVEGSESLCYYSFSQRCEKDHKKHHGYFVQHHSFAQKLFKALTKREPQTCLS